MKRPLVALVFCFCSLAMYGQKMRLGQELPPAKPGDTYPIKVHVSAVHYRSEYIEGQNSNITYADVVMNGKKLELRGDRVAPYQYYKLSLGDYQARLLSDPHKIADTPIFQVYDMVLPDKTVGRFTVTGITE